jgi:uncharacterized membrane protein YczE
MENKITIPGELTLIAGLLLISFAIPLMLLADFGISTISSLPYALSKIYEELSFGTWNMIFQMCLLVILLVITKRFKTGYVLSILLTILFGSVLDLFALVVSGLPTSLELRLLYFIGSFLMMCVGIAMMVGSKVPLMIVDTFINDLSTHFHVTFRRMKTLFDIICLTLSIIAAIAVLGNLAGVGVGTVIMAIITGSGVHAVNKLLSKVLIIRPWSRTLSDMAR